MPRERKYSFEFDDNIDRHRMTALVISYNRIKLIKTCLSALAFADEILVVDKSSTDGTAEVAATIADRVISVPWSSVVEDTRAYAIDQCKYEWILCIDDDECLSSDGIQFFHKEMRAPRAKVYAIPQRHYIIGCHQENAYYWPEYQPRFFHRDYVKINSVVHGGITVKTDEFYQIPLESGVCLHHLSHKDVSQWVEKANRYTSIPGRLSEDDGSRDLIAFSHARIDAWVGQSTIVDRGSYPAAVALLRAVYDIIDRLKLWESEEELGGDSAFEAICRKLNAEYARIYRSRHSYPPRLGRSATIEAIDDMPQSEEKQDRDGAVQALATRARHLRRIIEATQLHVTRTEAERRHLEERLAAAELHVTRTEAERRHLEERLASVLSSEFWRMTAPLRLSVQLSRRLTGRNLHRVRIILHALKPANVEPRREVMQALHRRAASAGRLVTRSSNAVIRAPHIPLRGISDRSASKSLQYLPPHEAAVASYPIWSLRFDTPSATDLRHLEETAVNLPEILVITRFSSETLHLIRRTADALKATAGVRWHAVFITDNPDDATFGTACMNAFQGDMRFLTQLLPGGLTGRIILLLEAGAIPRSHGIRLLVETMVRNPDLALIYSDEDWVSLEGLTELPWFKPKYSPLLAVQGMLFGRMFAIRPTSACGELTYDVLLDPSQSVLQIAIKATRGLSSERIGHVAHVLFHNVLPPASVQPAPIPPLETLPVVSIFIPTRDHWYLLGQCLESLRRTDWPADRLEVIVIDNGSTDTETLEGIAAAEASGQIRIIRDGRKFNYAALNNVAARAARGDVFVLLNNDTEIVDPTWLHKLCAYAIQPDVGAVGAKLLYADRIIQHGGVILGIQGAAAHAHVLLSESEGGYQQLANITHEIAAVTGACLAVSRAAFEAVGGLREEFEVAFNDLMFCLDLYATGRRNIYVSDCVLIHHESKTRGFDTTPQKIEVARREALRSWLHHPRLLRDDPYYSPNLSLESPYQLAFAPRRRALWLQALDTTLKIMMLSSTYARGHGVAVVIDLQVRALRERGHEVILAGAKSDRDFPYGGTEVIEVHDPRSAATIAADLQVDVIVAHTPPFFGVARWTGAYPPVIGYDYGEPPSDFFPDAVARREALADKNAGLRMCARVFAISQAIADESLVPPDKVIPLGNSHLGVWAPALVERREAIRRERGWTSHCVILNVCRFHAGERKYKGVDQYADMLTVLKSVDPDFAARCIFVLCGKGDEEDVAEVRARGLTVIANVSDEEMLDLYAAADLYANFSRWEGYNLGIGQALAMGLKVIASDIPAHRAFGIRVVDSTVSAAFALLDLTRESTERVSRLWGWDEPLRLFAEEIECLAHQRHTQPCAQTVRT